MEQAVENLEKQMQKADEKLDSLAVQVGNIGIDVSEENGEIEVFDLLQSVNDVRTNYQNLRKEISEVQVVQKQLSTSLHTQIQMMQSRFNVLKEKIITSNVPQPQLMPEKMKMERHPEEMTFDSEEEHDDDEKQFAIQGNISY